MGPAEDEHQDGRHHVVGAGQHRRSAASSRRRASARGIYDREGVTLGQSYTRTYTFARTSGGGGSTTYNVSLGRQRRHVQLGAGSISLPKNAPTTLDVTVNPTTTGVHSAILNLDDPATAGIDYQTMNTVVVAGAVFTAANNYTVTKTDTIGRNQTKSYFFRVPAGTPAFKVDFTGPSATPGTGQARFLRFHPYGVGIDSNASTNCYSPPVAARARRAARSAGRRRTRRRASGRSRSRRGAPPTQRARRSR